jgi:hypothetical protein
MALVAMTARLTAQMPAEVAKGVDALIKSHIEQLIKSQAEDGHWNHEYEVGMTALVALALKHSNDPHGAVATAKAVSYIVQHRTEFKTYSAGMVLSTLFMFDPRANARVIDRYAAVLVKSQILSGQPGMFSYDLVGDVTQKLPDRGDNSNTQFGVLGLLYAQRAGFQVPARVWENLRDHYTKTQNTDGGWGYLVGNGSTQNMTLAGTVSLYIAEEQLTLGTTAGYVMTPPSRPAEAAMKWVGSNFTTGLESYGLYALERLGILTGRGEFDGHYWYEEGARQVISHGGAPQPDKYGDASTAFLILFLSRGKEPIIINKLKYYGDWDTSHYDVKHITEYMSDRMQNPMQWRVVTLDSKIEDLLKVPILHYNGIKGAAFTDEEKVKIRDYVLKGGVLMAQACSNTPDVKAFDEPFRALMDECFPEGKLEELPADHPMFENPKKLKDPPKVFVIKFGGRIGVIYLPKSLTLDWHRAGGASKPSFDAGINIITFVLKQAGRPGAGAVPIHG